jgi:hypothetical protein
VGLNIALDAKKFRGMRRKGKYAAVTRDEGNAVDGPFCSPQIVAYPHPFGAVPGFSNLLKDWTAFLVKENKTMKTFSSILIIGTVLLNGCASDISYKGKMTPQVEKIAVGKSIPLEAGLLITPETRDQIYKSPPFPDYHGTSIIYNIEPYQLPIGQAFEEASIQIFSQIFQKVHLIRKAEESKNYPIVIEPKLADFSLSLFYSNYGLRIYNEYVDGKCSIKVTGTLMAQGRPIWQKSIEPSPETNRWVNSYWLIDNVSGLASDTIVLALKELAYLILKESIGPPPPAQGWLEEIGEKR